jgi:hypothetical protein
MPLINDPDGLSQGGETSVAATTFASPSGAQIVITSVNVPAVTAGDYIEVRDANTAANNGLYVVDSTVASVSITASKQALTGAVVNPALDASSLTIRIFGNNANEKNIHFDTTNLVFSFLASFGSTTVLDNAGVIEQALYSFMKEEWKNDNDMIKFIFPMTAITPEQFEFNTWKPVDEVESTIATTPASDTRSLIRTGGWDEVDANGFIEKSFFGMISLGNIDPGDFAYWFFASQTSATFAKFDQAMNEAIPTVIRLDLSGAGTIAFVDGGGGNDQLTRTTGSWITDGLLVGDHIFLQNAEDAGNDGTFEVLAVTATDIDVATASFTANIDDTTVLVAIDRRPVVFTARIREFGKTYGQQTTTDIGVSLLTNGVFRFPLSETSDPVVQSLVTTTIAALLTDISGTPVAPYNDMAIGWFAADQTRSGFNAIGGDTPSPGDAQFGVIIEADAGGAGGGPPSAEQIYAFVQATIQEDNDINDPDARITGEAAVVVNGLLAEPLAAIASVGNTFSTLLQSASLGGATSLGVVVDNFDANDTNRVQFAETTVDDRTFPFVASGNINFNANLSTDVDAVYRMMFTNDDAGDNTGRDFGTINAITVNDNAASPIAGSVPQNAGGSVQAFTFDYDGNLQRGTGSDGVDAPITIVSIGLGTGQHVIATGTIGRSVGQEFTLVAALERNFSNPV